LRLKNEAALRVKDDKKLPEVVKKPVLHYGIKEVTTLIEKKKAIFVVIAHDVDPIETCIFLPSLCKKLNVPYCIVKSKSRVGQLCHMKETTAICLTEFNPSDKDAFDKLIEAVKGGFNDRYYQLNKKWGEGQLSKRSQKALQQKTN